MGVYDAGCQGRGTFIGLVTVLNRGKEGSYRRTIKLRWVKNTSRGRVYLRPELRIVLPKSLLLNIGVREGESLVYDVEVEDDGTIILTPLYMDTG